MTITRSLVTLGLCGGIILFLGGCAAVWGNSYNVAMANSRVVVIEFDPVLATFNRSSLLAAAQQKCSEYGKDAVLDYEESAALGIAVNHYRCETRKADRVIDVQGR